jgi:hypothetical protein
MFRNTIGKSTLVASAAALVLALALVASQAAGWQAAVAPERAQLADAARWGALAQHYAEAQANRERARDADAARWEALAQHYAEQQANRQRALAAEAARWTALAEYYGAR